MRWKNEFTTPNMSASFTYLITNSPQLIDPCKPMRKLKTCPHLHVDHKFFETIYSSKLNWVQAILDESLIVMFYI